MNACVITNNYPSDGDYYKNNFVHSRVKKYIESGLDVEVFVYSKSHSKDYEFEGVKVCVGNIEKLRKFVHYKKPQKLLVHFLTRNIINAISSLDGDYPIIVWIHGEEALGWYRRLFNFDKNFIKYILSNTLQLIMFRRFLNKKTNVKLIFVSDWMKTIAEKDASIKIKNFEIIPNLVDSHKFSYKEKSIEDAKKILIIRPFSSKKYCTDVIVSSIKELAKDSSFEDYTITIFGDGKLFEKTVAPIRTYKNVSINKKFLTQEEIKEQHENHGIFLCPTRQDAQGVSMCEAMSSGLVPITSNSTAIPEFVKHKESGFLSDNNPLSIAQYILKLNEDKKEFLNLSKEASRSIRAKCSEEKTIMKELDIIKNTFKQMDN